MEAYSSFAQVYDLFMDNLPYEDDWGFWDVCCDCGKKIEDGYHNYNHFDNEDHDVDGWDI